MRFPITKHFGRFLIAVLGVLLISHMACTDKGNQVEQPETSDDEKYLILIYAQLRYAESFYPDQPAVAESLFTKMHSSIDSVRIANTITELNKTPNRWVLIFREIEEMLKVASKTKL